MKYRTCYFVVMLMASAETFASPIQWSGNGHWYEYIDTAVTAPQAFIQAQQSTYLGMQGYLATVTSSEENQFVSSNVANGALSWLGGSDDNADINLWTWRNGPEAGLPFTYTNWGFMEPNNCCGGENYVHTNWNGLGIWNDHGGPGSNSSQANGYIIEYSPTTVPIPGAVWLFGFGLASLAGLRQTKVF